MIIGLDSASPPTAAQARAAAAAGVRLWSGYLQTRPNVGLYRAWTQANFAAARLAGSPPIAFCSGWDSPTALKSLAAAWDVRLCLDVEGGIRPDGQWVQAWLNTSGAGLYGNAPVHTGRHAAFHVLAAYPFLGALFPPKVTWSGAPPAGPCGWQWRGTHSEFGVGVDRGNYDDWFGGLHGAAGGALEDEEMTNAQYYRLLSSVYGVMLTADGTVQKDAQGVPVPTPATKMVIDAIAKIPGATAPDLHALADAVAAELSERLSA